MVTGYFKLCHFVAIKSVRSIFLGSFVILLGGGKFDARISGELSVKKGRRNYWFLMIENLGRDFSVIFFSFFRPFCYFPGRVEWVFLGFESVCSR